MKAFKSLLAFLPVAVVAAPAAASMSWAPVAAAPTLSPLAMAGLVTVIGIAGARALRNRRRD